MNSPRLIEEEIKRLILVTGVRCKITKIKKDN